MRNKQYIRCRQIANEIIDHLNRTRSCNKSWYKNKITFEVIFDLEYKSMYSATLDDGYCSSGNCDGPVEAMKNLFELVKMRYKIDERCVNAYEIDLVKNGKVIQAIKNFKDRIGCDLSEAKYIIDQVER